MATLLDCTNLPVKHPLPPFENLNTLSMGINGTQLNDI